MKKKIAFCIPNMIIGGVETIFITMMNEMLKDPRFDVVVVTHTTIREPLYSNWFKEHPQVKLYTYRPLGNWFEDLTKYCRVFPLKPLRKIIFSLYKKYRRVFMWATHRLADVDIFIDYKNFDFCRELKYFNKPKIAWLHSAVSYFEKYDMFRKIPQYDKIVALTDDFIKEFAAKYPQYADKLCRIYNAIDVADIRKKGQQAKVPAGKYFSHVARLSDGKDIPTLLDAFEKFYKKHKNVKLYVVGDGNKATEFKSYASKLNSCHNIVFTGSLDNPYGIMRGALANILSSEFEGFGMVLIEAMSLGTLSISTNCKFGPDEILERGKSGLLFEIGDSKQLAKIMLKVYEQKIDSKKIISAATKSLSRFTPVKMCDQIRKLCYGMNNK